MPVTVLVDGVTVQMDEDLLDYYRNDKEALLQLIQQVKGDAGTSAGTCSTPIDAACSTSHLQKTATVPEPETADPPQGSMSQQQMNVPGNEKFIWTAPITKLLIAERKSCEMKFDQGKMSHKSIWAIIARRISELGSVDVDWHQCQSKWNKLMAKFKATEDHNNKSGNGHKSFEFYDDMLDSFGENPNVKPILTISSMEGLNVGEVKNGNGNGNGEREKKRKHVNSELVELVKVMREERKEEKKERMGMIREMHEEKISVMKELLGVFRDSLSKK